MTEPRAGPPRTPPASADEPTQQTKQSWRPLARNGPMVASPKWSQATRSTSVTWKPSWPLSTTCLRAPRAADRDRIASTPSQACGVAEAAAPGNPTRPERREGSHASIRQQNRGFAGCLKPSGGLEPPTPSLPCRLCGNRSQSTAAVLLVSAVSRAFPLATGCHWLRPLCSISAPRSHVRPAVARPPPTR
jgi:hypothetical protein